MRGDEKGLCVRACVRAGLRILRVLASNGEIEAKADQKRSHYFFQDCGYCRGAKAKA